MHMEDDKEQTDHGLGSQSPSQKHPLAGRDVAAIGRYQLVTSRSPPQLLHSSNCQPPSCVFFCSAYPIHAMYLLYVPESHVCQSLCSAYASYTCCETQIDFTVRPSYRKNSLKPLCQQQPLSCNVLDSFLTSRYLWLGMHALSNPNL
jgi:hypothetical protein